jgi:hypothetical protein
MAWWIIGVWLASGIIVPLCWLLSITYRWLSARAAALAFRITGRHPSDMPLLVRMRWMRPYLVSGLLGAGALMLLFAGSSDPAPGTALVRTTAVPILKAAPAPRHPSDSVTLSPSLASLATDLAQAAAAPAEAGASAFIGCKTVTAHETPVDASSDRQTEDVAWQPAIETITGTSPAHHQALHKELRADLRPRHTRARGPSVQRTIGPSGNGTWLYPPTPNSGING